MEKNTDLEQFEEELPEVSGCALPRFPLARRTVGTNLGPHLRFIILICNLIYHIMTTTITSDRQTSEPMVDQHDNLGSLAIH